MTRWFIIIALFTGTFATASDAAAQWSQSLRTERDAKSFCDFSEAPSSAVGATNDPAPADETRRPRKQNEGEEKAEEPVPSLAEYDAERRSRARRPVTIWLEPEAVPVIGYDRLAGRLQFNLYRPAEFADGYRVQVAVGVVEFELPEDRAHHLWARYEAGTARLKLTFFPAAWSEYHRPLCRSAEDGSQLVDGEVLRVEIVDEVGQELVAYETELGHEVAMMRAHRIKGYLDSGMPVVTVSSLTRFPTNGKPLDPDISSQVRAAIRSTLYGCYLTALSKNARLQGATVVRFAFGNDPSPAVLVDSLHDSTTTACVLERLTSLASAGRGFEDGTSVKATVIFRLEETPGL